MSIARSFGARRFVALPTLVVAFFVSQTSAEADPDLENLDKAVIGAAVVSLEHAVPVFKQNKRDTPPLPTKNGIMLLSVCPYGPAGKAKLSHFDIITHVGKKQVKNEADFLAAMAEVEPGSPTSFTGFSQSTSKVGKPIYKQGTLKMTPVSKRDFIFGCLRSESDKFQDTRFYHYIGSPEHRDSRTDVSLYIGAAKDKPPSLRMQVSYVAKDWVFAREYIFLHGKEKFSIPIPLNEATRDIKIGGISEFTDMAVNDAILPKLDAMLSSRSASMRFNGDKDNHDRDISSDEFHGMQVVLQAFKILKSESN